jgi:hypothetical protein
MTLPMPPENTFDHLRKLDGEHVGYIHMTDDGGFVPFDLLHRRRSEATNLESAESLLDDLGLRMFMDEWWLSVDGQHQQVLIQEVRRDRVLVAPTVAGAIAKSADMTKTIEVPLPTGRLFQGQNPPVDE